MDKILLIDGMNAIWRANIGFKPYIKKNDGWEDKEESKQDFVMTFNFFRNLRPIIEQFSPDKVFFVLEGRPIHRYNIFPAYKANRLIKTGSRLEAKNTVDIQKDIIINLIKHLPFTIIRAENYECDDVIGTLVENLKNENVTILSSDSDFIQLLQKGYNNLNIYNPIKKQFIKAPAYHYLGWKCLAGDASDNIPKLLTPAKALKAIEDPNVLSEFLSSEEKRSLFNINKELIEIKIIPEEELILEEGVKNFPELKKEFIKMEFASITNDSSWEKYTETFKCIKF